MTLYAPLDAGQEVDSSLEVSNAGRAGMVKGPKLTVRFSLRRGIGPRAPIGCVTAGRSRHHQDR